jgi:hypothetical protein
MPFHRACKPKKFMQLGDVPFGFRPHPFALTAAASPAIMYYQRLLDLATSGIGERVEEPKL